MRLVLAALLCVCCIVVSASVVGAGEKTVRVGVVVPLSGALTSYGKSTLDGIRLRVDELNAAGGVRGAKIELVVEDNKGDKTESRNAYMKLAGTDEVAAVIGPITSTCALNVRRAAAKLEVPVVSPTATNDKVTLRNDYMFRTCFNDSFQGRIIANYCRAELKLDKAATFMDKNSDYSKGLCESFIDSFEKLGGDVVAEEGYRQEDTEFGAQLTRIKKSGAGIIFVPGYPPEVPLVIKAAKVVGFEGRLCGADGWDNDAVINGSGENIEGCFLVGAFSREDDREAVRSFVETAEKTFEREPGTFEALGYDSVTLLAEGMKKGLAPKEIAAGLLAVKDLELVTGVTSVDENGDAVKSAVVLGVAKDGDGYTTKYLATVEP